MIIGVVDVETQYKTFMFYSFRMCIANVRCHENNSNVMISRLWFDECIDDVGVFAY